MGLCWLGTSLDFYLFATSAGGVLTAGQLHQLMLTRDASWQVTGYLGGLSVFNFNDSGGVAVIQSSLALFQDESVTDLLEAQSGFVNLVQIHDVALCANELPGFGVVPEPASWALMIRGFGLVGATMWRRAALAALLGAGGPGLKRRPHPKVRGWASRLEFNEGGMPRPCGLLL